MAKINGAARIVGIAGGADKYRNAAQPDSYDQCIDYKTVPDLASASGDAAPDGIDVHCENVGGAVLMAAIDHVVKNTRIALCNMIFGYNAASPDQHLDLWNLVVKTARVEGFLISGILGKSERIARMLAESAGLCSLPHPIQLSGNEH